MQEPEHDEGERALDAAYERASSALGFVKSLSTEILVEMEAAGVDAMEFARQHARERINAGFNAQN